jgi:hypothetical protein
VKGIFRLGVHNTRVAEAKEQRRLSNAGWVTTKGDRLSHTKAVRLIKETAMVLRIRFGTGPKVGKKPRRNRRLALAVAGLLTPAAALTAVLALWRIAADLNWTGSFAISAGFFSHWQVWLAAAALLQFCARVLNRYAKTGQTAASG